MAGVNQVYNLKPTSKRQTSKIVVNFKTFNYSCSRDDHKLSILVDDKTECVQ